MAGYAPRAWRDHQGFFFPGVWGHVASLHLCRVAAYPLTARTMPQCRGRNKQAGQNRRAARKRGTKNNEFTRPSDESEVAFEVISPSNFFCSFPPFHKLLISEQAAMSYGMHHGHHDQEGAKRPRHDHDSPAQESEHDYKVLFFSTVHISRSLHSPTFTWSSMISTTQFRPFSSRMTICSHAYVVFIDFCDFFMPDSHALSNLQADGDVSDEDEAHQSPGQVCLHHHHTYLLL